MVSAEIASVNYTPVAVELTRAHRTSQCRDVARDVAEKDAQNSAAKWPSAGRSRWSIVGSSTCPPTMGSGSTSELNVTPTQGWPHPRNTVNYVKRPDSAPGAGVSNSSLAGDPPCRAFTPRQAPLVVSVAESWV